MTLDEFWELIHRSSVSTKTIRERTDWLVTELARLSAEEIVEFELHLTSQRLRADTRLMWGAAWWVMQGWCSDDGFWYFQPWLVGLGRDAFEGVVANPDALAELQQIRRLAGRASSDWSEDEWPQWETLNYVAIRAHKLATGEEGGLDRTLEGRGLHRIRDPFPKDELWDFNDVDEARARFPHLASLLD